MFLEILQNSYFNTHTSKSLFETAIYNFIDKKTPPEACSCDFCKIFKNTFLKNTFRQLLVLFLQFIPERNFENCIK